MAVFCTRCGTALPVSARFCSNCGVAVPIVQPTPGRSLLRPRVGRQIAGVCVALAQTYGWEVGLVRIIAVVSLIVSGGLVGVAYVAGWIGIPEEPEGIPGAYPPNV